MSASTVGELLREATERLRRSGSETARLDAEVLLTYALNTERSFLLAHPEVVVSDGQAESFERALTRRETGEPVAYIRGFKEFYGLAFRVDGRALIPRPETELLVDLALARLRKLLVDQPRPAGGPPLRVWDIGTGSGAVAVAVAVECRRRGYDSDVRLLASDISSEALALAVENAVSHGVADLVDFATADVADHPSWPTVELIMANLPYIPSAEVPELPVAASFEPVVALDGGDQGLELITRLLGQLPDVLARGGMCLLEIGSEQVERVLQAAAELLPGWPLGIEQDLAGEPRVAQFYRPLTELTGEAKLAGEAN